MNDKYNRAESGILLNADKKAKKKKGQIMESQEGLLESARVLPKSVIGCQRFKRPVMLAISIEGVDGIFDFFLTEEQRVDLIKQLQKVNT